MANDEGCKFRSIVGTLGHDDERYEVSQKKCLINNGQGPNYIYYFLVLPFFHVRACFGSNHQIPHIARDPLLILLWITLSQPKMPLCWQDRDTPVDVGNFLLARCILFTSSLPCGFHNEVFLPQGLTILRQSATPCLFPGF